MDRKLGARIVEELQRKGMTQKELARQVGMTEGAISRYISGEREPKIQTLANIATALQTTSDYLLGIEGEEFHQPRIRRMIARNAGNMTEEEKRQLIDALFGKE